MCVFMKATVMSQNKNSEVLQQSHDQQDSRDLVPKVWDYRKPRPERLRIAAPRIELSLAWVQSCCDTDVWTALRQSPQLAEVPDTR